MIVKRNYKIEFNNHFHMKKIILTLFVVLIADSLVAQQDSQFTNYMYNTININPAYAGSRGSLSVLALHRNQWVGFDGAPITNTFSLHTPINNTKLGLGVSLINDRIGPSTENNLSVDLAYAIPTSDNFKIALGVKGTLNLFEIDWSKLNINIPSETILQTTIDNKMSPNVGAGLYFYSDKTYVGVSVPNMLETQHFQEGSSLATSSVATERMHYYFMAGHVFDLSQSVKFKPAMLTKVVNGSPLQVDVSTNFLFNDKFTAGLGYRWDRAFSGLLGFQFSKSWFMGYAYDMEVTKLANYNSGSHEIVLRYELFKDIRSKVIVPRFF
jgi:type IX secretion system PorP/SprF family membrane protein